jgi:hypothetical protein
MRRNIVAVIALLAFVGAWAADFAKIGDIVANPNTYGGRHLTVAGTVAKFKAKMSRIGKPYYTFDLREGKSFIAVYGRGELDIVPKDGERVEATGLFAVERESAGVIFKNELDLTSNGRDGHGLKIFR